MLFGPGVKVVDIENNNSGTKSFIIFSLPILFKVRQYQKRGFSLLGL